MERPPWHCNWPILSFCLSRDSLGPVFFSLQLMCYCMHLISIAYKQLTSIADSCWIIDFFISTWIGDTFCFGTMTEDNLGFHLCHPLLITCSTQLGYWFSLTLDSGVLTCLERTQTVLSLFFLSATQGHLKLLFPLQMVLHLFSFCLEYLEYTTNFSYLLSV